MTQEQIEEDNFAQRNSAAFFEKFDKYDTQELLSYAATHWQLSTDDFRAPTEPPLGVITHMQNIQEFNSMIMMPVEEGIDNVDMREIHQIVRELTYGIYVVNQVPSVSLEPNFDLSTTCQLPPAYQDTRVGQLMIDVDYMMKALWHGSYFPREKRLKFSERWRGNLDVNSSGKPETKKALLTEFITSGMIDVSKDPDYEHIYDKLPVDQPGDAEMAEERRYFMSNVEDMSMQMTLFQKSVKQYKNLFVVESDWIVSSVVKLLEDQMDQTGYERLNAKLQLHELMVKEHLCDKAEVRKQLYLLKIVSFLVPFLMGMKKRMKIPHMMKMLPNMAVDDVKTERELPPLMLGPEFKCKNFNFGNHYFHLHGGVLIDNETPDLEKVSEEMIEDYESTKIELLAFNSKWTDKNQVPQESYLIPVRTYGDKSYFAFMLEFETFYPQAPQKPRWVQVMCEEISKLQPKRQMNEQQVYEQFRKYFGYKKAIKYKNLQNGLKAAAVRGLVSVFWTLCIKCPASRLGKQDEQGMALIHYAAMYNRPQIIAVWIIMALDINIKKVTSATIHDPVTKGKTGPTPLHLAARCGSLDAVACLVSNYANVLATDQDGWAPVHHAAYFDHEQVVKMLIRNNDAMLEFQTKDNLRSTPLLLAASSGALSALKCLIDLGAFVLRKDEAGNNVIHLAAMRFHTNVLEFFIEWGHPDVPVWSILVEMLADEDLRKKDAAVKCLEVMSTSDTDHWQNILSSGGVPALVQLLTVDNEEIQSVAASVLCNISEHDPVRKALTKAGAAGILISLLGSHVDEIQSRAAIVLSDLACVDDNQSAIAEKGGIPPLVNLLDSEIEDVLVNTVNAIRVLCSSNAHNQSLVADCGGIEPLVEFLQVSSDILQAASAAALAALCAGHKHNQNLVVQENAVAPLVALIKCRKIQVQVKAAAALESLADHNAHVQEEFLKLDAPKHLMRLLKIWSMEVKEQGACSLWTLAGQTKTQQKDIASRIGIPQLIDMLLLQSEKLQYVGCMGMVALGREDIESQNRIAEQGGIQPLVRLLRSHKTSERVLLTVIKVIGTLCLGLAHKNNRVTQRKFAEESAISILVQLMLNPPSQQIKVEVAYTLGCVVLSNHENQEKLQDEQGFKFDILLHLLATAHEQIRLKAGFALAIFAFNNTPQQFAIREAGGIRFECFQEFLESENEYQICNAAFQIVVLARVIVDIDQVTLTAEGVERLVNILRSDDDNAVILAASLMSSLAHTRAGIPDAMLIVGAIDLLINKLASANDQVRFASAVCLGYLTFNRTAGRALLVSCRNTPGLYERIMKNIGKNPKISKDFLEEIRCAKSVGIPCLSLEKNGGPSVNMYSRSRAGSPVSLRQAKSSMARLRTLDTSNPQPPNTRAFGSLSDHNITYYTPNPQRPVTTMGVNLFRSKTSLSAAVAPNTKRTKSASVRILNAKNEKSSNQSPAPATPKSGSRVTTSRGVRSATSGVSANGRPAPPSRASTMLDENSDNHSQTTTASKANMGFLKSQLSAYNKSKQEQV